VRAKTFPKRLRHYSKPQASDSLAFVRLAPSGLSSPETWVTVCT